MFCESWGEILKRLQRVHSAQHNLLSFLHIEKLLPSPHDLKTVYITPHSSGYTRTPREEKGKKRGSENKSWLLHAVYQSFIPGQTGLSYNTVHALHHSERTFNPGTAQSQNKQRSAPPPAGSMMDELSNKGLAASSIQHDTTGPQSCDTLQLLAVSDAAVMDSMRLCFADICTKAEVCKRKVDNDLSPNMLGGTSM